MDSRRQRVVIVGGGFGGLRTALQLAKYRTSDIVLIDENDTHVYTPWLYEVASGRTDYMPRVDVRALRHSAGIPFSRIVHGTGVQFRRATVAGLDAGHRHVIFADHTTLAYDALVIAVGSQTSYFGIPGLDAHALPLKTLDDARAVYDCMGHAMERARDRDVHIVVGGAGPSGVELVSELATMVRARERRGTLPRGRVHFSLIDAAHTILGAMPPVVARTANVRLRTLGIRVLLDTMVTRATEHHVTLAPRPCGGKDVGSSHTPFAAPTDVPCDCMVWCGGVVPSALAVALPLPKDDRGRIRVDASFEVVGQANIFALGDIAVFADASRQPLPQTAQAADVASTAVAKNVVAALASRALTPFKAPRSWPFVIAIGAHHGIAYLHGVVVTGFAAYILRRAADLRYLLRILPLCAAYCVWRSRMRLYAKND